MTAHDKTLEGRLADLRSAEAGRGIRATPRRFSYSYLNRYLAKLPPFSLVAVMLLAAVIFSELIANFNTYWIVDYLGLFPSIEDRFSLTALNTFITTCLVSVPLIMFSVSAISALESSRKKLRRMRDLANSANVAKSEFLANMSHELRTPLNAIIGFSEIITNETFGPVGSVKYRDYVRDINQSGQHLLDLINDILDLAKIESGEAGVADEVIDVAELAQSVPVLLQTMAERHGVDLAVDIPDRVPKLRADRRKLQQILVNLLSNAVKFTPAGGSVTLRVWRDRQSELVLQITDNGIGIAAEDIPKAMAKFGQVDSAINRKFDGTGLGLPLVKSLVDLHGGRLELASELGVGTTVTVRFPKERVIREQAIVA